MRLTSCALASTVMITLAGCGARNPVAPVTDSGSDAADQPFVLTSALDARLPAPMEEARDAGATDLAITGHGGVPREERRRASPDPVLFWNGLTTTLGRAAGLPHTGTHRHAIDQHGAGAALADAAAVLRARKPDRIAEDPQQRRLRFDIHAVLNVVNEKGECHYRTSLDQEIQTW